MRGAKFSLTRGDKAFYNFDGYEYFYTIIIIIICLFENGETLLHNC